MLYINCMCLSGKLLKIGNHCKEKKKLNVSFGIPIGAIVYSEGYSEYF